jgi:hypothetical protein
MAVVNGIKELADQMRIKQGALIQLMFERFVDDDDVIDDETSDKCAEALEQIKRGERYTLDEVKAAHNARKTAL